MEIELTSGEQFFLNVYRFFEFLRVEKNYIGKEFSLGGKEEMWISFYSNSKKITITIIIKEDGFLDFVISKKGIFFSRKSIYDFVGVELKIQNVSHLAKVVKQEPNIMREL